MRVAALYDIHGNLPALRAALADAERERVDALLIGGDVVLGPMPLETIEHLMALGDRARFVRGNSDREVVEAYDRGTGAAGENGDEPADLFAEQLAFTTGRLSAQHRDFLESFEPTVELDVDGLGRVLFCHGSPRSDTEIITSVTPDQRLRQIIGEVEQPVVVGGHTHRQFDREIDGRRIVNAGSVGLPYEGRAAAYWALLGPDVELRHSEYDLGQALAEFEAGGCPDVEELLRESLLEPADPDEVAEYFEREATGGAADGTP